MLPWHRRLSRGALLALGFVAFLALAYACFATYKSLIPWQSGTQSDYLIDAYYYIYLGEQALHVTSLSNTDLVQAVADLQPNQSSFGIVLLSSLSMMVSQFVEVLPLAMGALMFWATWRLYSRGQCNGAILLLPFSGLFPYYFLPSKELFCVVSLLFAAGCLLRGGWSRLGIVPAAVVMYLARPEAAALFAASVIIWTALQSRRATIALVALAVVGYLVIGREGAYAASTIFQLQSDQSESAFCNVGPLDVCVGDLGGLEQVYAQRLVTLLLLPVKWVTDVLVIPITPDLLATERISRVFVGVQVIYIALTLRRSQRVTGVARHARGMLMTFAVVYGVAYGCVLYFQPTRQLVLATTVACIALSIENRRRSPALSHPQPLSHALA